MTERSAVVLVDKPPGPTSHDVVAEARRRLDIRRVGHTGTLDPFASGLLILCVGAVTRLVEYFHLLPKTYEAGIVFGEGRDTDDRTGEVTVRAPLGPELDEAALRDALAASEGRFEQRPPAFSARRKDGERAYEAARRGETVLLEARPVEVAAAELLEWSPPRASVRYAVSTGTYVRALARDLGKKLGCPAHLGALRRTAIGPFAVEDADAPEEIGWERDATLVPLAALDWLPRRELDEAERVAVRHGQAIVDAAGEDAPLDARDADLPIVLHADGRLIAIGRRHCTEIRPEKVFDVA